MSAARDPRVYIYAGLDLIMALLYAVLLFGLIPNRHAWVQVASGALVVACLAMATAMLVRRPATWWVGVAATTALLALAVLWLVLTLMSAAFLAGTYGSFGQAGALFTLMGAALIIELVALLPAFQLKFLMTRAGRRAFGRALAASAGAEAA
ncbi:hypothetical protein [Haliangium sp.]|uniref:hypothetical protein n=1 Tax=Haliangium sp. TaxID=2663208 RepID=UPI003D0980D2